MTDPGVDLSRAAFVHPTACVYGNVEIGEGASLWPYVSISIVMGAPATVRKVRNSYVANRMNAWMYSRNALAYARGDYREWDSTAFRAEMPAVQVGFEREFGELYRKQGGGGLA